MEALWDSVDKLKISTRGAILLVVCISFAVVCVCTVIILKRKASNNKIAHQEGDMDENEATTSTTTNTTSTEWSEPSCGWISVKRVLMGPKLWSRAGKLEDNIAWQKDRGSPLLGLQRHNSASAVWQRPILRGEKCELPSFSGLILYDEKGRPLRDSENETICEETSNQEKTAVTMPTTLKDLLQ